MWWLPLATALALGAALVALHYWYHAKLRSRAATYRLGYVQLVAKIEAITVKVNNMEPLVHHINDHQVLDYYESCLRLLENLLSAIAQVPNFGSDPAALRSAFHLANECGNRVDRTFSAFKLAIKGRQADFLQLFNWKLAPEPPVKGCYFCSRPYLKECFKSVKTKISGVTIVVHGCEICREELRTTKKVKVLYFMKSGQPVHWSQVKEYTPTEHYWKLNEKNKVYKTPQLELIYSRAEDDGHPPS